MGIDELERRVQELHAKRADDARGRAKIVLVVFLCVVVVVVLGFGVIVAITDAPSHKAAALPVAVTIAPDATIDVAPPLASDVERKLAAYRAFLADVDGTLHALRLECPDRHERYLSLRWPSWLPLAELATRLDELVALSRAQPAIPALDGFAALYVETVRAELPAWTAAVAAWEQGAEAYAAASAPLRASFERFGANSLALRDAMPPEGAAEEGTPASVMQTCAAGVALVARAAVPPVAGAVDVEAEPERTSVYAQLAPGEVRDAGLRCARAALDLLEHADEVVWPQVAVQMGLALITEEERRQRRHGSYITSLGNYVQLVAYAVRARK